MDELFQCCMEVICDRYCVLSGSPTCSDPNSKCDLEEDLKAALLEKLLDVSELALYVNGKKI